VYQRSRLFRPVVVRFGNILGSSGSVVEIMADTVRAGRNVPVTDPSATRFFMTAEEAVSLIIKADLMGRGGDVFWLDMGKPLRIGELAHRVIEWATPAGQPKVGIEVIGLRPGEKLREELTTQGLEMKPTSHARIFVARQLDVSRSTVQAAIRHIRRACAAGDAVMVLDAVGRAVPDYEPSEAALKTARLASLRVNAPSTSSTIGAALPNATANIA
jgi:FlaA1/EpsC-like NDP-sugar epimerase